MEDIRGQGYDGAGNMAGKLKGVQARITELNDKALYVHCAAHCLNLSIVKACSVKGVKNMFAAMKELSKFFLNSPKRQRCFEDVVKDCEKKQEKEAGGFVPNAMDRNTPCF